jgi:Tol biopolymer transport system component
LTIILSYKIETNMSKLVFPNPDGSEQKNLTRNPASDGADHCLPWSPDGKKLAFTSTRDGSGEICIMNADGSGQKNLTNDDSAYDGSPFWSPFLLPERETQQAG